MKILLGILVWWLLSFFVAGPLVGKWLKEKEYNGLDERKRR
jgi:hypothetical protein